MWRYSIIPLLLLYISVSYAANDVVIDKLKMYVNGREWFIKAMCYAPAPLGQGENGGNGGGFCSPKVAPWGSLMSTCYDSDYFDGGGDAQDRPQPTEGGWFQPVWRRDFPIIKSLGVNTLRLYSANPTTKKASIYYPEVVPLPLGKDHVPFMDMANVYGLKVIFPLISDYDMLTHYPAATFKRLLRWQIDELCDHPALLMWGFGNELPLFGNQDLLNLLNTYIAYIKQYTLTKCGRRIPVTCAVVDLPNSYDGFAANMDVDVFTTNAGYRGFTFTDLWSGNGVTQGWYKLSCRYNKPVFIGEINWHSLNNAITISNPDWFNQIWKDLVGHMNQGCIGGAFFEYSDEKLKADPLQQTMGVVHFTVNATGGRPSTDMDVWNVDTANPKDIIFDAVKSGSYNGVFYNMNADPFYLSNTVQSQLGQANDICASFNLQTCPGANTCSYHGRCDRQTGTCTCNLGWGGSDCSQAMCTDNCSGRGSCVSSVSPPVCICNHGWTGPSCTDAVNPTTCAANCVNGNGKCDVNGNCVCFQGWYGHDCAIPDISYPPSSGSSTTTPAPTTPAPTTPTPTTPSPTTTTTTTTTRAPTTTTTPTPTTTTTRAPTTTTTPTPTTTTTRAPTTTTPPPATSTTSAPTTPAPTTPAPTTSAPTTTAPTTTAPTTSAPTTSAPTTPTPTTSSTFSPPTTPTTSTRCGWLKSCGEACYNEEDYSCFDGMMCPKPLLRCGTGCYNTAQYACVNNWLQPVPR